MAKNPTEEKTPEEIVATALNEQGFLFSQKVRETIRLIPQTSERKESDWSVMESEYPVTAADGFQTRIDHVLKNKKSGKLHVCLECKRCHPHYKRWIFFDRADQIPFRFENFTVFKTPIENLGDAFHGIAQLPHSSSIPIFNLYLESAIRADGKSSHTDMYPRSIPQSNHA